MAGTHEPIGEAAWMCVVPIGMRRPAVSCEGATMAALDEFSDRLFQDRDGDRRADISAAARPCAKVAAVCTSKVLRQANIKPLLNAFNVGFGDLRLHSRGGLVNEACSFCPSGR